ncbi:MAG: phospho-N-acetylmuramoyl-pentapeptide-transferase [Oscillospiraceae bacterium]|nr:phospho-N-acetylmuramoyl-pentapeptide-transferase [Oscillospiraceae bacterium]
MQSIITCALAFLVSAIAGRFIVPALRALKVGQSIREIGPTWHNSKQGTPTMGGLIFMLGIAVCVITGWRTMLGGDITHLMVFGLALVCGVIGFLDDFVKVKNKRNLGLTEIQKLVLQLAAAALFLILLRRTGHLTGDLYIPFANVSVTIPWILYLILSVFIIVGTVNAVNITDGIDGLNTSVTIPVMVFYAIAAWKWHLTGASLFAAAVAGALLGFLIYNWHPAKVFMGDTGSLFLGGAVCGLAYALDMPLILILVGIIYIAETMSDIIQVAYFKLTHGKRIFRMAPLHHHFEKGGWSEVKIVVVFTSITVVFCILAYLGVMNRF